MKWCLVLPQTAHSQLSRAVKQSEKNLRLTVHLVADMENHTEYVKGGPGMVGYNPTPIRAISKIYNLNICRHDTCLFYDVVGILTRRRDKYCKIVFTTSRLKFVAPSLPSPSIRLESRRGVVSHNGISHAVRRRLLSRLARYSSAVAASGAFYYELEVRPKIKNEVVRVRGKMLLSAVTHKGQMGGSHMVHHVYRPQREQVCQQKGLNMAASACSISHVSNS